METKKNSTEDFLPLLMSNQRKIHSYIRSLVFNFSDADDIMQETITTMWSKFDQFELGSDFASWGVKIAYFKVLNYRKKQGKDVLSFNDNILEQISDTSTEKICEIEDRVNTLRECIKKLGDEDRQLLDIRYELNCAPKSIALQLDKSVQYIYKNLSRIHFLLNRCIKKKMQA